MRSTKTVLSHAVLEYIREHPGCYTDEIVTALQPQFPDKSRKALQSVPARLKFEGKVATKEGSGYHVTEPPAKHVLKIEFDNPEALRQFGVWLCESGEQDYWQWMEVAEERHSGPITAVRFDYHPIKDPKKPENSPARYGDFLGDNTIRTVCGRQSDEDDGDDGDDDG